MPQIFYTHVRAILLTSLAILISCAHQEEKDGYQNYQASHDGGLQCGKLMSRLPSDSDKGSWDPTNESKVKTTFLSCLNQYMTLNTHAQSLEFFQNAFAKIGIDAEKISYGVESHLIASLPAATNDAKSVILFHPTDLVNGQMVSQEGKPVRYLWGQKKVDVKSVGILQLFSMALVNARDVDRKKNLIFIAANHSRFDQILKDFPQAEVVLNEGGYGFEKNNRKVFLLGTEQKGGAWLKLTHKNPARLMSHLDQLMAVFMPHEPRDYSGSGGCRLRSFSTRNQTVNKVPDRVDLEVDCKNMQASEVGRAFKNDNISFNGRQNGERFYISIEQSHLDQRKLGEVSPLQVAAFGLQQLSVIPFRDWSFEQPKFYKHQRTPASLDFAKKLKNVYSTQSAWGDLLWEFSGRKEWSSMKRVLATDKKGGPEGLFRTTCHWTGFEYVGGKAQAYIDCRLMHTGSVRGSQSKYFVSQLKKNAKDPHLGIQLVKGWDYTKSSQESETVSIIKNELQRNYPDAYISSWVAPTSLGMSGKAARKIPSYGFQPVLTQDFLEQRKKDVFPPSQAFVANKIYSGIVSRLVE